MSSTGAEAGSAGTGRPQPPVAVLDYFKTACREVRQVLGDGRQVAQVLGPIAEELDARFQAAMEATEASRLNLVVMGPEGAGKSTLLAAVVGADVTPRDATYPGTVVPVFLQWSADPEPAFWVERQGTADPQPCTGEDFERSILQRHNEHNEHDISAGYVRWDHPLLEQGLVLVDMPGVEGVSPGVARLAQDFIRHQAHAVIGVVRDRNYAPLLRVARQLAGGRLRMQALVSNWSLDAWREASEEDLADFVATQQKIVVDFLRQQDANIDIGEADVYVLHLPSVRDAERGEEPTVTSATHERERVLFKQALWEYVRSHGVSDVVAEAVRQAAAVLGQLDAVLAARHGVLQALIDGDQRTGAEMADQLRAGWAKAQATWATVYNPAVADVVATRHWEPIRLGLDRTRQQVLDSIAATEARVRAHSGRLRKPEADALWRQLCQDVSDFWIALDEDQDAALDQVIAHYGEHANAVLDDVFQAVPVVRASVPAGFGNLNRDELMALELRQVEEHERERLLKHPLVDRARDLFLGPIAGLVAKVLLKGALAATRWWESLREGERPTILASLERARDQVLGLDLSEGGEIRRAWGTAVERAVQGVDRHLKAKVAQLEGIVADPQASLDVLLQECQQMEHARSVVSLLTARLQQVTRL